MAPATSPSEISRTARPLHALRRQVVVARAVQDDDAELLHGILRRFDTSTRLSVADALMSIEPRARGQRRSSSCTRTSGTEHCAALRECDDRQRAGRPWAVSEVPSTGLRRRRPGRLPVTDVLAVNSMGASSFSPSPMTTIPSMEMPPRTNRMASTPRRRRRSCRLARPIWRPQWRGFGDTNHLERDVAVGPERGCTHAAYSDEVSPSEVRSGAHLLFRPYLGVSSLVVKPADPWWAR